MTQETENKASAMGAVSQHQNSKGNEALVEPQSREALLAENNQLQRHVEMLQEREKAHQELLAMVSHEIRTPIGAVIAMVDFMKDGQLDESQKKYLGSLQLAAVTLETLTSDLLRFSSLKEGRMAVDKKEVNLTALLKDLATSIAPRVEAKGLEFKISIDPLLPTLILTDQVRLCQVITNLTNNALKFTEQGTLELIASAKLQSGDDYMIEITVKDTGIGISLADQIHIFEPFTRANNTIGARFGGTGLGLFIARQLAECIGGKLSCVSREDEGAAFTLAFQATATLEAMPEQTTLRKEPINGGGNFKGHLLLVEDNELNQMLIKAYLDKVGLTYDCVFNGLEALNAVEENEYDIIIMDIMMPVMDGVTAAKELHRRWAPGEEIPILALTANALDDQIEEYYEAGMQGYISKPIRVEEFFTALANMLNANRARYAASSN